MTNRIISTVLIVGLAAIAIWYFMPKDKKDVAGKPLAEVVVPDLNGAAAEGKMSFDSKCASCHGENAAGQEGVAPPLVHKIYEPNHHGDMSFVLAAKQGVRAHHWPFGNMPPIDDVSDEQIKNIIAYIRTLQRANGIN